MRTNVDTPSGSAYRFCWQGITRPLPRLLSEVRPSCQSRPSTRIPTSSAVSSRAGVNADAGSAGPGSPAALRSGASVGGCPSRVDPLTTVPVTTTAATAAAAPIRVWVRRRAAPARRRIDARGQRESSTRASSCSQSPSRCSGPTARCSRNFSIADAVCRSVSPDVRPSSRARSASDSTVKRASTSALRCWSESLPRASKVALASGSRVLSRCQIRAVWRRCAWAQAMGRTHASGSGNRLTLRQWCQVTTKESRTADRAAGRSPVNA